MEKPDRLWLAAVRGGHSAGRFGHREHVRLAWLALVEAGTPEAATLDVSACLRAVAAAHGVPQKYNATVTAAWVQVVHHVRRSSGARTFEALVEAAPWLLDKRLLLRHYRSRTLASAAARSSAVPPDLHPLPG